MQQGCNCVFVLLKAACVLQAPPTCVLQAPPTWRRAAKVNLCWGGAGGRGRRPLTPEPSPLWVVAATARRKKAAFFR